MTKYEGAVMNKQYDAVIFDLDGTLIDSMWVWKKVDEVFLSEQGISVPDDIDKEIEGKSFTETAIYFKQRFKIEMSVEEIIEQWKKMAWDFYTKQVPLKEGAKTFLEWLKEKDIKMGIATSNNRELVTAVLEALDIKEYFSQICTSCEVGRGKPFPDIYLKVAEELGVPPSKCLVFEDIPNGLRAGKAAGMTAWGIFDHQTEEMQAEMKEIGDNFIQDYHEVMQAF